MTSINSPDYRDYVIKDGKFIGEFEQMYRNIDDPWHSVEQVDSLDNDLFLGLIKHISPKFEKTLGIGCGLGALTARIQETVEGRIWACDISKTAIEKARQRNSGIHFFVQDLNQIESISFEQATLDLITMIQAIWYILPSLERILSHFHWLLKPEGHLIVLQYFLHPNEQKYGNNIVETPDDFIHFVQSAGFRIEREVYINPRRPQNLLLWAMKGQS